MKELREDPELKPMFDEMAKGGIMALWKYSKDKEFMKKINERVGDVLSKMMAEAAAKQSTPAKESSAEVEASPTFISLVATALISVFAGSGLIFTLLYFR